MGMIIGNNKYIFGIPVFPDYTPTCTQTDPNYPVTEIKDFLHLLLSWHDNGSAPTIQLDFGVVRALQALFLDGCNFTAVTIKGGDTGSSWPFEYNFTLGQDVRISRYKAFIDFMTYAFNYRYMQIIPTGAKTDGLSYYHIGRAMPVLSYRQLFKSPTFPIEHSGDEAILSTKYPSGGSCDINLGEPTWESTFGWDAHQDDYEADMWALNAIRKDQLLVYFENCGDVSQAYCCKRITPITVIKKGGYNSIQRITLREVV